MRTASLMALALPDRKCQSRLIPEGDFLGNSDSPNYLPSGGRHVGAAFFRDHVLPSVTDVFDFARFNYDNVVAEDGHVVAIFNIGVTGSDAIIKIVDHWTVRDGKAISLWAAYFEPQAVLEKLGIKHCLGR